MGIFSTIWDIGEAAGPILAGVLIATFGYPPAFALIAALIAVVARIFVVYVSNPQTTSGHA